MCKNQSNAKLRVWEVFFVQKTHRKTQLLSFSACCSCWELACQIQRSKDFAFIPSMFSIRLRWLILFLYPLFVSFLALFMLQLAQVRLETEPKKNVIYGSIFGCKNFRNHRKKGKHLQSMTPLSDY